MKTPLLAPKFLLMIMGLMISPLAAAEAVSVATNTGAVSAPTGPLDVEFISKTIHVRGAHSLVIHYFTECQVERGHGEYDIVVNRSILTVTARQTPLTNDSLSALCSNDGDTSESNLRATSVGTVVACSVTVPDNYPYACAATSSHPAWPAPAPSTTSRWRSKSTTSPRNCRRAPLNCLKTWDRAANHFVAANGNSDTPHRPRSNGSTSSRWWATRPPYEFRLRLRCR